MSTGTPELPEIQSDDPLAIAFYELQTAKSLATACGKDWFKNPADQNLGYKYRQQENECGDRLANFFQVMAFYTMAEDPDITSNGLAQVLDYWIEREDQERVTFLREQTGDQSFMPAADNEYKYSQKLADRLTDAITPNMLINDALRQYSDHLFIDREKTRKVTNIGSLWRHSRIHARLPESMKLTSAAAVVLGVFALNRTLTHFANTNKNSQT